MCLHIHNNQGGVRDKFETIGPENAISPLSTATKLHHVLFLFIIIIGIIILLLWLA